MAISRQAVAPGVSCRAMPIRERSPSFLQDRSQGGAIPDLQDGIEHDLGASRGNQDMAVTVPPSALQACLSLQSFKYRSSPFFIQRLYTGGQDHSFPQLGDR